MSHNFKPGDLALIINASDSANIGKVVELVRSSTDSVFSINGGILVSNPKNELAWEVVGSDLKATSSLKPFGFITSSAAVRQCDLMPLRGNFTPEEQKYKEVDKCL